MVAPRNTPARTGSNKALWGAVAVVMVIVLAMGAMLIRSQTQPQDARPMALPASTEPVAHTSATADSAATGPVTTAAPVQPAPAMESSGAPANAPRTVHLQASEPAVARSPAPGVSR